MLSSMIGFKFSLSGFTHRSCYEILVLKEFWFVNLLTPVGFSIVYEVWPIAIPAANPLMPPAYIGVY